MPERLNLSVDEHVAQRARQCGARFRGGASAYVTKLIRQDELREAGESMARWYAANPSFVDDAAAEAAAALDEAS